MEENIYKDNYTVQIEKNDDKDEKIYTITLNTKYPTDDIKQDIQKYFNENINNRFYFEYCVIDGNDATVIEYTKTFHNYLCSYIKIFTNKIIDSCANPYDEKVYCIEAYLYITEYDYTHIYKRADLERVITYGHLTDEEYDEVVSRSWDPHVHHVYIAEDEHQFNGGY